MLIEGPGGGGPFPAQQIGHNVRRRAAGLQNTNMTPKVLVNQAPTVDESATMLLGAYRSKPAPGYISGHPKRRKINLVMNIANTQSWGLMVLDPKQNPEISIDETWITRSMPIRALDETKEGAVNMEIECGPSCEIWVIVQGLGAGGPDITIYEWFG